MPSLSRLGPRELIALEDRYADQLVTSAAEAGFSTIIAQTPRAWVDLNRAENEYDPGLVSGGHTGHPVTTAKVRGGLGIIPRRIPVSGDIWRASIQAEAFEARLAQHYRPYHVAVKTMLAASLRDFGVAILIDVHSMPPLPFRHGEVPAKMVIGDLWGKSADRQFTAVARRVAQAVGIKVAENEPYAGGHILERHASKARGIHALQIELDRSLYLDDAHDQTSDDLGVMQALILELAKTMSSAALSTTRAIAAE